MCFVCFLVVASLAGCFTNALGNEPKCHSKFDYDEKLLSKLIRMEVAMEAVVTKVEQMEQASKRAIAEMQQKSQDIESNFNKQKEAAEKALDAVVEKAEASIAAIRKQYDQITPSIYIRDVLEKPNVVFHVKDVFNIVVENAGGASNLVTDCFTVPVQEKPNVIFHVKDVNGIPTANNVIKFSNVVENAGGAYSLTTGCLTAPLQGTYWFTAHMCTVTRDQITPSIYIRDVLVSRVWVYDGDAQSCGSVSAVSVLQKNDEVCLKSGPHQSSSPLWKSDAYTSNNFMGALIN